MACLHCAIIELISRHDWEEQAPDEMLGAMISAVAEFLALAPPALRDHYAAEVVAILPQLIAEKAAALGGTRKKGKHNHTLH